MLKAPTLLTASYATCMLYKKNFNKIPEDVQISARRNQKVQE